jgi:periplasmic copper chaperone A
MRIARRLGAAVAAGAVAMLASVMLAGPAWAHVTVDPSSAPKGAEITLGFRVPNEEATASTVKIQIFFPAAHPVLGVDPESAPGWTDEIHTAPLNPPVTTDDGPLVSYVSELDWSGGAIRPGHFQEFYVLAQQLPTDTDQVVFKALQTYSNGDVVRWIQSTPAGGPEPDHPAPVLTLTGAGAATDSSASSGGSASSGHDTTAIVGIVLGAVGVVLGGASLGLVLRRR